MDTEKRSNVEAKCEPPQTNLDEADSFVRKQRDGADTRSRYAERVEGRPVGLKGGGHHDIEVNLCMYVDEDTGTNRHFCICMYVSIVSSCF